jgi:hypothetical protein
MSPIVNTDVKMPKVMLDALTLHETFCVASGISFVTTEQVQQFLTKRFNEKLANQFKPEYLFNNQAS